jgi:hypothetical protein
VSEQPTPPAGDGTDGAPDVDEQLARLERFIEQVQAGRIGTSEAMAAYRDVHLPAIARLRAELEAFRALLDEVDREAAGEDTAGGPDAGGMSDTGGPPDDQLDAG